MSKDEIPNNQRDIISGIQNIGEEIVKVFKEQFNEDRDDREYRMLEAIPSLITQEDNERISNPSTEEEVKVVVFSLNVDNTSGHDGFSGLFFQKCWDTIGKDITRIVQDFFARQGLPTYITHTNLVPIPKREKVVTFSDLRPSLIK